jgi:nucleoside-diphosphate-sugar epimerase
MRVLVTGAAGKLGSAVCALLAEHGYELRAMDLRAEPNLGVPLSVADLRDDEAVYPLVEGCDAVVHLGNHPNLHVGGAPQRLLAENTAMNANGFRACVDLGVRRIVFASSVQAMLKMPNGLRVDPPYTVPYFPLDGAAPANPGCNFYALSKEFAERMLQELAAADPKLSATSLRFPALMSEAWLPRFTGGGAPLPRSRLNFGEVLAYLMLSDAAELVRAILVKQGPGYHQYYPAQTLEVRGYSAARLIQEFYASTPLRRPLAEIDSLVDVRAITEAVGWAPKERLSVDLAD